MAKPAAIVSQYPHKANSLMIAPGPASFGRSEKCHAIAQGREKAGKKTGFCSPGICGSIPCLGPCKEITSSIP
jgi:hypothetical protein